MSGWSFDIMDMSWVEGTVGEVDFVVEALQLQGHERVLDLACGFGRHSIELARRGYSVVGIDITADYIEYARNQAENERLDVEFIHSDVIDVRYDDEFDVVLNMADGAIGSFRTEEENLRLFDIISSVLKPGGKHVMGVCSADYAVKHFPSRAWEAGKKSLSLADFKWQASTSRMIYESRVLKFGEVLEPFSNKFPDPEDDRVGMRLYTRTELRDILRTRGMTTIGVYGAYDTTVPASDDLLMSVVCSCKEKPAQ